MKSVIVSGLLLLIMAAYVIIPVVPVIDYLINKDYIAKNFCINKDKPKSCCKGKCHMVKQLQKTNNHTENNPKNTNSRVQLKELNEFIVIKTCSSTPDITSYTYFVYNIVTPDKLAYSAIFVPPESFTAFS